MSNEERQEPGVAGFTNNPFAEQLGIQLNPEQKEQLKADAEKVEKERKLLLFHLKHSGLFSEDELKGFEKETTENLQKALTQTKELENLGVSDEEELVETIKKTFASDPKLEVAINAFHGSEVQAALLHKEVDSEPILHPEHQALVDQARDPDFQQAQYDLETEVDHMNRTASGKRRSKLPRKDRSVYSLIKPEKTVYDGVKELAPQIVEIDKQDDPKLKPLREKQFGLKTAFRVGTTLGFIDSNVEKNISENMDALDKLSSVLGNYPKTAVVGRRFKPSFRNLSRFDGTIEFDVKQSPEELKKILDIELSKENWSFDRIREYYELVSEEMDEAEDAYEAQDYPRYKISIRTASDALYALPMPQEIPSTQRTFEQEQRKELKDRFKKLVVVKFNNTGKEKGLVTTGLKEIDRIKNSQDQGLPAKTKIKNSLPVLDAEILPDQPQPAEPAVTQSQPEPEPTPLTEPVETHVESEPAAPIVDTIPSQPDADRPKLSLEEARQKFVAAEKALSQFGVYKKLKSYLGSESKSIVESNYDAAQKEYARLRAEYVDAQMDNHLNEQLGILKERSRQYGEMSKLESLYEKYKKIPAKYKILVNLGLLGAAAAASFTGFTFLGAAALGARVGTATLAGGASANEIYSGVSGYYKKGQRINSVKLAKSYEDSLYIDDAIQARVAELLLKGRSEQEILDDPQIKEYSEVKREINHTPTENLENYLKDKNELLDRLILDKLKKEQSSKDRRKITAAAIGAALGTRLLWMKYFTGASVFPASDVPKPQGHDIFLPRENIPSAGQDILHNSQIPGAAMENLQVSGESVLKAGSRGIEGALLDLKQSDPDKYKNMVNWLKQTYQASPEAKDSDLIHRHILNLAKEKGWTVDGGGKDLSDILGAEIHLGSNGQVSLDEIKFIPEGLANPESAFSPEELPQSESFQLGPDEIKIEPFHLEGKNLGSLAPEAAFEPKPDIGFEQVAQNLSKHRNVTDAVKELLKKNYNSFMKNTLKLSARSLNKIQTFSVADFQKMYTHSELSPKQRIEFKGLADLIIKEMDKDVPGREQLRKLPIRKLIIKLALK